jgi:hypothetical protein
MATNANTVPQEVLDEILEGLKGVEDPIIDQIPGIQSFMVDALSGKQPVLPSSATLPKVTDEDAEGLPEGAEPNETDIDWSEVSFDNRRYPGFATITDGVAQAVSRGQYTGIETLMRQAKRVSAAKVNRKLSLLLKNTSFNEAQAVLANDWADETSTPIKDMQAAVRKIGAAPNIGIFGHDVLQALQVHPDFLAKSSNFEAGVVDKMEVAELLRKAFGLSYIIVGGQLYNAAADGLTPTLGYEFDGVAWLGYAEQLVKTEQNGTSPNVKEAYNIRKEASELLFSRRLDILRPHKECGVIITGVI